MVDETPVPAGVSASRRSRWIWPGLIIALLGLHVVLVLVTVFVATRDRSFAVEPDYYQKALHWEQTQRQRAENGRLGWKVHLDTGRGAALLGERTVTCRIADDRGQPVAGAAIDLVAFAHARGNDRQSAVMTETDSGTYAATLRVRRKGVWEFRLVVHRGRDTFTHDEQRTID